MKRLRRPAASLSPLPPGEVGAERRVWASEFDANFESLTPAPLPEGEGFKGNVSTAIYDHTIPACAPWSGLVRRGQVLRIIDTHGQQAVDTLFYAAGNFSERYSAQDTLREQGSAYVTTGTKLMSSEGRMMATVVADTCGSHDTSAGACSCEANTVRFGKDTRYLHACRENFLIEVTKHGMGKRDIVANINFFMNVPVEPDGRLAIVDGVSAPGAYVEVLAEMDLLCVISNCPQINNPCNGFDPTPVRVLIFDTTG